MNTYLISYDLMKPGKDYTNLISHIKKYSKWAHPLESVWLIKSPLTSVQIRNSVQAHIDQNDKVLVVDVTSRSATWINLPTDVSNWIQSSL